MELDDLKKNLRKEPATEEEIISLKFSKISFLVENSATIISIAELENGTLVTDLFGRTCVNRALKDGKIDIRFMTHVGATREVAKILLPSRKIFDSVFVRYVSCAKNTVLKHEKGGLDLPMILAYIKWIPGFNHIYDAYRIDLDACVTLSDAADAAAFAKERTKGSYEVLDTPSEVPIWSISELTLLGYAVILMMMKSINKNVPDHMKKFLEKRLKALHFSLDTADVDTKFAPLVDVIKKKDLEELNEVMSYFPRLKVTIFTIVLAGFTPPIQHMAMIFAESQMTVFSLIDRFLSAEVPTKLHVYSPLLTEIMHWASVIGELKAIYGISWPFYKLIEPRGTSTSQRKIKRLAVAAMNWVVRTYPGEANTIKQLKGFQSVDNYFKLAGKEIPAEYLTKTTSIYRENCEKMMQLKLNIPINWEKIADLIEKGEDGTGAAELGEENKEE